MQEAFPPIPGNSRDNKDHVTSQADNAPDLVADRAQSFNISAMPLQSDRRPMNSAQKAPRPSPNKKNFKKPDNSLLNFHFERPTPTTSYQSQSGVRNTTITERRNKARASLLSKESFLQAK